MEFGPDWKPRVPSWVVEEAVDDQLVLYDTRLDCVHLLNTSAAAVFDLCDGRTPVPVIVSTLREALRSSPIDFENEVPRILAQMLEQGLLE